MQPDFNPVAWLYYPLSRLVFGRSLRRSQAHFLTALPADGRILMVGGGNGDILRTLLKQHGQHAEIVFVESAPRMIRMAQQKTGDQTGVHFVNLPVEQFLARSTEPFDAIVTGFFFDLFPQQKSEGMHSLLGRHLRAGGIWLDTDFCLNRHTAWWGKPLLGAMYAFFRITARVAARQLPDLQAAWNSSFGLVKEQYWCQGFIVSRVWQRQNPKK